MQSKKPLFTFLASLLFLSIFSAGVLAQPWYLYDGDDGNYNVTSNDNFYGFPTRREAGNYSGGVTPYIGEDPDQDSSLSDFYIGNESGFTTFIDGVKNQTKVGDFSEHPGLVSYWPLDNANAWDPISGNNGTLNGDVLTGQAGQVSKAMDFDGLDDWIDLPASSLDMSGTNQITASFWIKPDFVNTADGSGIVGNYITNSWAGQWIVNTNSTGGILIGLYDGSVFFNKWVGEPLTDGVWQHVVVVLDNVNGDWQVYTDGSLYNSGTFTTSTLSTSDQNSQIGTTTYGNHMAGGLDEVRVYDRALSSAEISALYNATKPTAGNDPTLGAEETSGGGGNSAPEITITDPTNTTYFDYDIPVDVNTSDPEGDNYDCNVSMDEGIVGQTDQEFERFYSERDKEESYEQTGRWDSDLTNTVDENFNTSGLFKCIETAACSGTLYQNITIPKNVNLSWTIKYKIFFGWASSANLEGFCWNGSDWESFYYDDTKNGIETKNHKILDSCLSNSPLQIKEEFYELGGDIHYYEGKVVNDDVPDEGLGSHTFNTNCEDSNSNTSSDSVSYTVDNYEFQSQIGASSVYETSNQSYDLTVYSGDMVNSINTTLLWNGTEKNYNYIIHSGISNETLTLWYELPLVETNTTTENWNFEYDVNYNLTDGSNTTSTETTSSQSQDVLWAYWINNLTTDKTNYIEGGTLQTDTDVEAKLNNVDLQVETTFNGSTTEDNNVSYDFYENSFTAPAISPDNKSFNIYSNLTVSFGGKNYVRDSDIETITNHRIKLTDCSGSNPVALNFSLWDETNQTTIKGSLASTQNVTYRNSSIARQYTFSKTDSHYQEWCIYPAWTSYIVNTKSSSYDAKNYNERKYYLRNATIGNTTSDILVYLSQGASYFTFKVEDREGMAVDGVITKFNRYYPTNDTYKLVAQAETSEDGTSAVYLELENVKYRVIMEKGGEILKTVSPRYYNCNNNPCYVFSTKEKAWDSFYEYEQGIAYQCQYNPNSNNKLICELSDPTGLMSEACLDTDIIGLAGSEDLNKTCGTSSSLTLVQDLSGINDTIGYELNVEISDGNIYTFDSGIIDMDQTALFGTTGLLLTLIIFLTLSFIGLFSPSSSIMLGSVGLIISVWVGLLSVSIGSLVGMLVVAGLIIYRVKS